MLMAQLPAFFFLGALVLVYPKIAAALFCIWLALVAWRYM